MFRTLWSRSGQLAQKMIRYMVTGVFVLVYTLSNISFVSAASAPNPPSFATATTMSHDTIELRWGDGSTNESSFHIDISENGAAFAPYADIPVTLLADRTGTTKTWTYTAQNLKPNTPYRFNISAVNSSPPPSASSGPQLASATTHVAPYSLFINGTVTETSIPLDFQLGNNSIFTRFSIKVQATGSAQVSYVQFNGSIGSNQITDTAINFRNSGMVTGLQPNTEYTFTSTAVGSGSNLTQSIKRGTAASVPTGVAASALDASSIHVTWSGNATQYWVEDANNAATNSGWITGASFDFTNLACGTNYAFKVKGQNIDGVETAFSAPATTDTASCPPPVDTTAPTGSVVIGSGNPTYTNTPNVTLNITYADDVAVQDVRYSNDGVWDAEIFEAAAATKAWTLPAGDGVKTVYYQVRDTNNNLSVTYSDTITLDTTAPTASVSYSTTDPTNGDVIATLVSPSETIIITDPADRSNQHRFTSNGSFTFQFVDEAGNVGTADAVVANIDKIAPTASFTFAPSTPTNGNVTATLVPSETVNVTNNNGSETYTFTTNGSFVFQFVDAAGNTGNATAEVSTIDQVAPTGSFNYSTTSPTNGSVVATLVPSEQGVTVTNNNGSFDYAFTENDSFTFQFVDAAGNAGSAVAQVNNIDRVVPNASVNYSTTAPTSGNVTATLAPNEAVTVTNNNGSDTYTFTNNGSFTFEFSDAAGNTGSVVASVNNIDRTAPSGSINYSITAPTTGNVVATFVPNETVTITNNNGSDTYTFTDNGRFTFEFRDEAGNTGNVEATVTNIDREAPTASFQYAPAGPTNQNVVATLVPSETVTVTNNNGSFDYTFTNNDSFTFQFIDAAGNTGSAVATVNNIDIISPSATFSYTPSFPTNGNVVATLVPSEVVSVTNNNGNDTYTFTTNGSFTFQFVDAAGNTGSAVATVSTIDREVPVISGATTVTITQGSAFDALAGVTVSDNSGTVGAVNVTGSVDANTIGDYLLTYDVSDAAGNTATVIRTVRVVAPLSSAKDITSFSLSQISGAISGTDITVTVPAGTDVTNLIPTIVITGVSVNPASGDARDFTNPVSYTVTAEDSSTKTYTVTVTVAAPVLQSIAVTQPATKLAYLVGESLDITGLEVTGTYNDNSTRVETVTLTDVSGFDSSAPAQGQVLMITINGKTTTYTVDIAPAPPTTHTISGTVKYYDPAKKIAGATVILENNAGIPLDSTITDVNGFYRFTGVADGGDYAVRVTSTDISTRGVTNNDQTAITRHLQRVMPLDSIYKIIAGDVNNSRTITNNDQTAISRILSRQAPGTWKFYDASAAVNQSNYLTTGLTKIYTNFNADAVNQDFVGIKMGDVNNSWN